MPKYVKQKIQELRGVVFAVTIAPTTDPGKDVSKAIVKTIPICKESNLTSSVKNVIPTGTKADTPDYSKKKEREMTSIIINNYI